MSIELKGRYKIYIYIYCWSLDIMYVSIGVKNSLFFKFTWYLHNI